MRMQLSAGFLALACVLTPAMSAWAQFWPGYGYGYGDAGVMGAYTSAMNNRTSRYVAQSDRLAGQRAAMQQQAALQGNIRSTMESQAQARTQASLSQQQSNRDWWFQVQQQQVAQRRSMPAAAPSMASAASFEPAPPAPKADTDIIQWLPILCEPQFTQQRQRIEAPYRNAAPGKANPTLSDYETMIDATDKMKEILSQMTAVVSAMDYMNAEKFLDKLAGEARQRIEQIQAAEKK